MGAQKDKREGKANKRRNEQLPCLSRAWVGVGGRLRWEGQFCGSEVGAGGYAAGSN